MKVIYLILFAILLSGSSVLAQKLSPLAKPPEWSKLEGFQNTITREEFLSLLQKVYAPHGGWEPYLEIRENEVIVKPHPGASFTLQFTSPTGEKKKPARYWKAKAELGPAEPDKPLAGLRIALDPGHLGGSWAKMEERWFKIGNTKPVAEGDMTLYVAKLLAPRLQALGAKVYLTRGKAGPVTTLRPGKLRQTAAKELMSAGKSATPNELKRESELLFYRVGEIRQRAELINEKIKPDLVLCLHFNAEEWGDDKHPKLTEVNHMHFLITGDFSAEELAHEDQLYEMLIKLLNQSYPEEIGATDAIARSMATETGLPPYEYKGANAVRVNDNPYVWGRNLLASRLFECPVIFAEPYVMNSNEVFKRVEMGQYTGKRMIGAVMRESIFNEYVNGLVRGLVEYYSKR
ncbi:MAG: N-acetylmuramoyl-L-alanine amidase [Chthoniobacterales bacterium]